MRKTYDKHEALKYLSVPSRIILKEIWSSGTDGTKLLILGSSRPERARGVTVAIQYPGGSMAVYSPDSVRAIIGNRLEWSPIEKACEILRGEIAQFFYMQLARSRESMILFRFDILRLLNTRMYLRILAGFNRLLIEANDGVMHDLGSRERETGIPDKLFWVDGCHGKLDDKVYRLVRTIVHHHAPESNIYDHDSVSRRCVVNATVYAEKGGVPSLELKRDYGLSVWPTANQLLEDHADIVRSKLVKPQ